MPKRKEPELTPAEQIKRFREAAKKAEVTKDESEFELAFKKVAGFTTSNSLGRPSWLKPRTVCSTPKFENCMLSNNLLYLSAPMSSLPLL